MLFHATNGPMERYGRVGRVCHITLVPAAVRWRPQEFSAPTIVARGVFLLRPIIATRTPTPGKASASTRQPRKYCYFVEHQLLRFLDASLRIKE